MSETYDWDWVEVSDPSTKLVYYANPVSVPVLALLYFIFFFLTFYFFLPSPSGNTKSQQVNVYGRKNQLRGQCKYIYFVLLEYNGDARTIKKRATYIYIHV